MFSASGGALADCSDAMLGLAQESDSCAVRAVLKLQVTTGSGQAAHICFVHIFQSRSK